MAAQTPFQYHTPRTDVIDTESYEGIEVFPSAFESVEPVVSGPIKAWAELEPFLDYVETGEHPYFSRVARLEFVKKGLLQGLIMIDGFGQIIVHVTEARIGYNGDKTALSRNICNLLGVPAGMFEAAKKAAHQLESFTVIFTREDPDSLEEFVSGNRPLLAHWKMLPFN